MTDRLLPELADLDLRTVDPGLHDLARKRFAARDALGFVALTDNDRAGSPSITSSRSGPPACTSRRSSRR